MPYVGETFEGRRTRSDVSAPEQTCPNEIAIFLEARSVPSCVTADGFFTTHIMPSSGVRSYPVT